MALPFADAEPAPENWRTYWERKNREVDLLRRWLGDAPGAPFLEDGLALLQHKLVLRARMIARFHELHPFLTESNLTGDRAIPMDGSAVDYSYWRYDVAVRQRRFAPWIYPCLTSPRICSLGMLTASGQSALCAVLTACDISLARGRSLYLATDTYYEGVQYARSYLYQLALDFELPDPLGYNGVLLLDSISTGDPLDRIGARRLDGLHCVIFDTTCYDVNAPEIERVVERCARAGVVCVLVRSHMKIDTLGLEYGRLGSIVLVLPRPCSAAASYVAKHLRFRIRDWLHKTGAGFSMHCWFPLTTDPEFRLLNGQRNALYRANNLRAAAGLGAILDGRSAVRARAYHHGRFLFLDPPDPNACGPLGVALHDALNAAGIYTRIAPSFGYDFLGILRISGDQYATRGGLRLSIPDYPPEAVDQLLDIAARLCTDLAPVRAG